MALAMSSKHAGAMCLRLLAGAVATAKGKRRGQEVCLSAHFATLAREERFEGLESHEDCKSLVDKTEYARVLLACGNSGDFLEVKRIHEELKRTKNGLEQDCYIGNILVNIYGKCGKWREAQAAFDRILEPNVISWSSLIACYAAHVGKFAQCMQVFQRMQLEGVAPNKATFINLLKAFNSKEQIAQGKVLHALVWESGYESDSFVGTTVMNMYGKCGSLEDARLVFKKLPIQWTAAWSVLMAGCVSNGKCAEAVALFYLMQLEGLIPDKIAFINVMVACSTPEQLTDGNRILACIAEHHSQTDVTVVNAMLNMLGKCGAGVEKVRRIFDRTTFVKNSSSWNTMIGIYVKLGLKDEALSLFRSMVLDGGSSPDRISFARVFTACGDSKTLEALVECMEESGVETNVVIQTILVNLYAEFGKLELAREVFEAMQGKDCVLWNVMVAAYAGVEDFRGSYTLFHEMLLEGQKPDRFTLVYALDSFARLGKVRDEKIRRQQQQLLRLCTVDAGLERDMLVSNAAISVSGKHGDFLEADKAFTTLEKDLVSWNTMIGSLAEGCYWKEALHLFRMMQVHGEKPNRITLMAAITAVSGGGLDMIQEAKAIHGFVRDSGLECDIQVCNSLIHMYAKSSLRDAEAVFSRMAKRDVVSWTALLSAYDQGSKEQEDWGDKAMVCFQRLRLEGIVPSKVTFITMLSILARQANVAQGRTIHEHIRELGLVIDAELASSLIDMYAERGGWEDSLQVFQAALERDVVVWNAMISSCFRNVVGGAVPETMKLVREMLAEGCRPSRITFAAVLETLSESTALAEGREIERLVGEVGLESDTVVAAGLINLYGKCGKLAESRTTFERVCFRADSTAAWNALIAVSASVEQAARLFQRMQQQGLDPDGTSFVGMLSACSHSGAVDAACRAFQDMEPEFGVAPSWGERSCIVDLLGRSGRLGEAEELSQASGDPASLALLASCNLHGDMERGRQAGGRLLQMLAEEETETELEREVLSPASLYVALSNAIKAASR